MPLRAGRFAGAVLTGAAVGASVAGIWDASWKAAGSACPNTGDTLCLPAGPLTLGIAGSALVTCAGVFLGFLALQVRPKRLTIPVGCVLTVLLTWAVETGMPGRTPPPVWAIALAVGAGLGPVTLVSDPGRTRLAGVAAIVIVISAAAVIPRVIESRSQQSTRYRQLAALGFPLMLAVAAGYHASGADAVRPGLSVYLSSDTPGSSTLSRLPAITVTFTPASSPPTQPGPGGKPVECQYVPPHPGCRQVKPGLWLLPEDSGAGNWEVITWRGGLEIDAVSLGYSPVRASALIQAATDLRPVTAATLAALGP